MVIFSYLANLWKTDHTKTRKVPNVGVENRGKKGDFKTFPANLSKPEQR